jgi:hypothetical protein
LRSPPRSRAPPGKGGCPTTPAAASPRPRYPPPKGDPAPAATAAAQPAAEPAQGEGYQVTPHVLRYYQTARI